MLTSAQRFSSTRKLTNESSSSSPRDSGINHPGHGEGWLLSFEVKRQESSDREERASSEGKGQAGVRSQDANAKVAISDFRVSPFLSLRCKDMLN